MTLVYRSTIIRKAQGIEGNVVQDFQYRPSSPKLIQRVVVQTRYFLVSVYKVSPFTIGDCVNFLSTEI